MRQIYDDALAGRGPGQRTRVLHIITRLIVGGAQENTIASVARIAPERYDSRLWIGPQTGSEGSLLDEARTLGIVPHVLPNLVREINPFRDLAILVQLVRLIKRGRFDIVHTHSSKAGIVGRIAARMAGVPHIVHTIHGWGFHEYQHPLTRRFFIFLERITAKITDKFYIKRILMKKLILYSNIVFLLLSAWGCSPAAQMIKPKTQPKKSGAESARPLS